MSMLLGTIKQWDIEEQIGLIEYKNKFYFFSKDHIRFPAGTFDLPEGMEVLFTLDHNKSISILPLVKEVVL